MTIKVLTVSSLAAGTIGSGGFIFYHFLSKTTVRQKLQEDKTRVILDNKSQNTDWENIVNSNNENTEDLNNFIKKYDPTEKDEISIEKLKTACENALKINSFEEEDINRAKSYCTKSKKD